MRTIRSICALPRCPRAPLSSEKYMSGVSRCCASLMHRYNSSVCLKQISFWSTSFIFAPKRPLVKSTRVLLVPLAAYLADSLERYALVAHSPCRFQMPAAHLSLSGHEGETPPKI